MIIGFNLIYNLTFSWLKQNFNRGYKLLHVFWNTLYIMNKVQLSVFSLCETPDCTGALMPKFAKLQFVQNTFPSVLMKMFKDWIIGLD